MSAEKLERVQSFGELSEGVPIVYRGCLWCGGNHRAMVFQRGYEPGANPDGSTSSFDGWQVLPTPSCRPAHHRFRIGAKAVARGAVWRIVDGLDLKAEKEQETKPKRARKPETVR